MLKRFTQYILCSETTRSGIDYFDDDVDIVNGVVIVREREDEGDGRLSEKSSSNPLLSEKSGFVGDDGKVISVCGKSEILKVSEEILNCDEEFGAEEKLQEKKQSEKREEIEESNGADLGVNIENVAGSEEGGVVPLLVSKGRTRDISGFWLTLQAAGRAKGTLDGYRQDIKLWQKFTSENGIKSLYNLKTRDVEVFTAKKDVNTARRLISSLKQLSKWYLRDGFPALNIEMQKLMSAKGKKRIPLAKEPAEFIRIRDEAKKMIEEGDRDGLWISLKLMCGLRISEIATVEVSDNFIQVIGKGDKQRRIPAPAYVVEGLKAIPATGRGGYKKSRFVIDRCLRKLGYTHLHSLRHTYATYLLSKGVKIEVIQKLLGHSSIATTQIYAQTKIEEGITDVLEQ